MPDAENRDPFVSSIHRHIPALYLLLALPITLLLCFLTAPFFAPDEVNHSLRAISLGHGHLIAKPSSLEPGASVDVGAIEVMAGMDEIRMAWEKRNTAIPHSDFRDRFYGPVTASDQLALSERRWSHHPAYAGFANTAVYPPWFYLPAIVGWRIGEAKDLTIFQSLHLARILTALTAVFLGWLALRLCACSRWMLLPFLLLPSTLFLFASCSQDALSLPGVALIAALLSRPLVFRRAFTFAELSASAILIAACATARPPYAVFALLLLLPALESRQDWLRPGLAVAFTLFVCALWRHVASPLGLDTSDEADPDLQRVFLLHHPFAGTLAILRGTLEAAFDLVHRGLYVVGWNDLMPHHFAGPVILGCVLLLLLYAPACPLGAPGKLLLAVAIAAPLLGISLAEYLIWTPPGHATVYGIQPRYWLPVLPFAAMLVQGRIRVRPRPRVLLGATAVLAVVACTLPLMAATAFYRESIGAVLRLNLR